MWTLTCVQHVNLAEKRTFSHISYVHICPQLLHVLIKNNSDFHFSLGTNQIDSEIVEPQRN